MMNKKYKYYIGIDTGVNTGLAIWNATDKTIMHIFTFKIHQAFKTVLFWYNTHHKNLFVRVEDARLRTWFGKAGKEQLQGAGSIKRDAVIWEDFLKDLGVDFEMVAPKNNKTKLNAVSFKKITGWKQQTNQHERDAAMLIYGI